MAGKIFISYRRDDQPGFARALFQTLEAEFGPKAIFFDVEGSIKAGQDFVQILEEQVSACDAMLAIIGPQWVDAKNEKGQLRLEDPADFVRVELVSALELCKLVIPVLVDGAAMPAKDQLPPILRSLARHQAVRLTHERYNADCQGLVKDIRESRDAADAARIAQEVKRRKKRYDARRTLGQPQMASAALRHMRNSCVFGHLGAIQLGRDHVSELSHPRRCRVLPPQQRLRYSSTLIFYIGGLYGFMVIYVPPLSLCMATLICITTLFTTGQVIGLFGLERVTCF